MVKKIIVLISACVAALAIVTIAYLGYVRVSFGIFNPFDPPDRVEYHGRRYYLGKRQGKNQPQALLDYINQSAPTGEALGPIIVNRLEVYETPGPHGTPTLLFLKQKDGNILIYTLSGGP
ncbi:MAG: hypothetical protein M1539_01925 [Actinobacteria bacterium]|nr:hypothetical protein [Actinomycetota bacterium]MCL5882728.1 hypothetical protein [Actinomycetota bacterium]